MKTFINVLYRRILYKIPLKLLLVILAVVSVCIAITKADSFDWNIWIWNDLGAWQSATFSTTLWDFICISSTKSSCNDMTVNLWNISNRWNPYQHILCVFWDLNNYAVVVNNNTSTNCPFYNIRWYKSDFEDSLCTTMTSLECQTEYSLIPISSVDQNYCTTNNLCPSSECPVCPVWTGNISNVYINDILHVGAPFIFIDIPEEIDWDYGYTQWWTNMLVNVEWYNVDYDYINWVVDIQNYKPDSEDLTNIVKTVLPLFVPWLCIILLLYFIFKFIKKIF